MKKVTIVTSVHFWRLGAGHRERIFALVRFLSRHTELTVVMLGIGTERDLEHLKTLGLKCGVVFLDKERVLTPPQYTRRLKSFLAKNPADVCIIEFIQLSFLLDSIPAGVKVMLDTHDIMSELGERADAYGSAVNLDVSEEREFELFRRYDAVILIQDSDYEKVRDALGGEKALLAPHPAILARRGIRKTAANIGYVASGDAPNVDAISWFIAEVWPAVPRDGVTLNVYGYICEALDLQVPDGVRLRGFVPSLDAIYGEADIVINPARFGGGLKIKNVEALANGLPLVTTPHGATGLEDGAGSAFLVGDGAEEFRGRLAEVLDSYERRRALGEAAYRFAEARFSPEACFAGLLAEIDRPPPRAKPGRGAGRKRDGSTA